MTSGYRSLSRGTYARSSKLEELGRVDAIVFDCDGVLIDVRDSYDATIAAVSDLMFRRLTGIRLPWRGITPALTSTIRRTGGFNNDWDTTYALIVFAVLSLPRGAASRLADGARPAPGSGSSGESAGIVARLGRVARRFASTKAGVGSGAVEAFIRRSRLSSPYREAVARARESLGYPGSPPRSLLSTTFDEMYFGGELFKEVYGFRARYHRGRGLIEHERVLVDATALERLKVLLGGRRMALATGRPFIATRYTMRDLLGYFDMDASVFIGDGDVNPEMTAEMEKFRKPSGESLVIAREALRSRTLLYVGDSAEDRMMVEDARRKGDGDGGGEDLLFAGVYGIAGRGQLGYFKGERAELILRAAGDLPCALEMARD